MRRRFHLEHSLHTLGQPGLHLDANKQSLSP